MEKYTPGELQLVVKDFRRMNKDMAAGMERKNLTETEAKLLETVGENPSINWKALGEKLGLTPAEARELSGKLWKEYLTTRQGPSM